MNNASHGRLALQNVNFRLEDGKKIYYQFECNHCGECCIFLDVSLSEVDILNWMQKERMDLIQYVQIHPQSINYENRLKAIINGNLDQLVAFILNNHNCLVVDKGLQGVSITLSPEEIFGNGYNRIFKPFDFQTMLQGMQLGVKYMLMSELNGYCIFFKGDHCSIHEVKPRICQQFPYDETGRLALNHWTLSICKGIKQLQTTNKIDNKTDSKNEKSSDQ